MADRVPSGYSWIRDLAPGVSYDDRTQEIRMSDGTVVPNSLYQIVNDRAYVDPNSFKSFLTSSGYKPLRSIDSNVGYNQVTNQVMSGADALPNTLYALINGTSYMRPDQYSQFTAGLNQQGTPPVNTMPIRDLVPNVSWDNISNTITLPNGQVVDRGAYTLDDGKAYVNPYAIAGYYQPQALTPERMQEFADVAAQGLQPQMDVSYQRLNNLVNFINKKLNANVASYEAAGDRSMRLLQNREAQQAQQLTKQAMARGTYTSGVADYGQRQLAQTYAPEYTDLQAQNAANIAAANAESQRALSDVASQGQQLEATYAQHISSQAMQMAKLEAEREQSVFNNIMSIAGANDQRTISLAQYRVQNAIARMEAIGYVATEADAEILGVEVNTPTSEAIEKAKDREAQLDRLIKQITSNEKIAAENNATSRANAATSAAASYAAQSAANDQRQFNQALAIWEQTGKAPDNPQLGKYGIAPNTAWNPSVGEQLQQFQLEQQQQETTMQAAFDNTVNQWAVMFGLDKNTATQAAYLTDGVGKQGALNTLSANKSNLTAQGVDVNALKRAIKRYYDAVDSGEMIRFGG